MSKMSQQLRQAETRRTIELLVERPRRAHRLAISIERARKRRLRETHRQAVAAERRRRQEEQAWREYERGVA